MHKLFEWQNVLPKGETLFNKTEPRRGLWERDALLKESRTHLKGKKPTPQRFVQFANEAMHIIMAASATNVPKLDGLLFLFLNAPECRRWSRVARIRGAESERSGSWGHWGSGPAEMNITPGRRRANTHSLVRSLWHLVHCDKRCSIYMTLMFHHSDWLHVLLVASFSFVSSTAGCASFLPPRAV